MNIYNKETLNEKTDKMYAYLKQQTPSIQEETSIVERLMMLGKMVAESGEYKSFAQYRVDEIMHGEIAKAIDTALGDKLSATTINMYVKTACKEWNYLVNAFDRINSAAAKQMMAIQTMISYEKQKMAIL